MTIETDESDLQPGAFEADAHLHEPAVVPSRAHDVVAIAGAGLFSMAAHTAVLRHANLPLGGSFVVASLLFLLLVGLHLALRPRTPKVAPRLVATGQRAARQMVRAGDTLSKPPVAEGFAVPLGAVDASANAPVPQPTDLALKLLSEAREAGEQHQPRPAVQADRAQYSAWPSRAQASSSAVAGFEQLQSLVAELARATPGPKASTPDPDAPRSSPVVANFNRSYSDAMERANVAQVAALNQAARLAHAGGAPDRHAPSAIAAELVDALSADRMTVYLEPIQQIESARPRHYEVFVRFKTAAGVELPHQELLAAARDAGLLPRIDAAVLPRAARIAQHFQLRGRDTEIFSHVHGVSLPDHDFRAEVTAATIAADGAALVLSFAQSDIRAFGRIHWEILSTMADMGLRFAVESVTDLDMDFESLKRRGFDFAKLDASVLLDGLPAAGGLIASADVCRHFSTLGLALIVSHIDDENALARILGFGVLFGQGALFGARRAVRADFLASPAAA